MQVVEVVDINAFLQKELRCDSPSGGATTLKNNLEQRCSHVFSMRAT